MKNKIYLLIIFLTLSTVSIIYINNKRNKQTQLLNAIERSKAEVVKTNTYEMGLVKEKSAKVNSNSEVKLNEESKIPKSLISILNKALIKNPNLEIDQDYLNRLRIALGEDSTGNLALELLFQTLLVFLGTSPQDIPVVSCKKNSDCPRDFKVFFDDVFQRLNITEFSEMKHLMQEQVMISNLSNEEKITILQNELTNPEFKYIDSKSQYLEDGKILLGSDALYALSTQERMLSLADSRDKALEFTMTAINTSNNNINKLALGVNLINKDKEVAEDVIQILSQNGVSDEEILDFILGPEREF